MELLWTLLLAAAAVSVSHATTKQGFEQSEKQTILDKHNEFRRVPNAADMLLMFWDNELEGIAQGWANTCDFDHNPDRMTENDGKPGENIFVTSASSLTVGGSVIAWNAEVADYTFSSDTCAAGKVCGHYTQVVWSGTYRVGCGVKYCDSIQNSAINSGHVVVCNYIEAGNLVGTKPYTEGSGCSQCPNDRTTCDNGLCTDGSSTTIPPDSAAGGVFAATTTTTTLLLSLITYLLAY